MICVCVCVHTQVCTLPRLICWFSALPLSYEIPLKLWVHHWLKSVTYPRYYTIDEHLVLTKTGILMSNQLKL